LSLRVQVELTTLCTCDCSFCPRYVIPKARSLGHIDPDTEALLLDRLEEYPDELVVSVSGFGEPLCYPGCLNFMRELKARRKVYIELNTNASLLTEEVAKQIIGQNVVDEIQISLSLPTKQLYEEFKLRSYDLIFKNLMNFYRMKGDRDPVTDIRFLHFKQTRDEVKYAMRFWGFQIGPRDALRVASLENWMGLIDPAIFGVEFKKEYTNVCHDLRSNHLTITKEGRVLPCCYAIALPEGHPFELGHIKDAALAEFLESERRRHILEMQTKGTPILECGTCSKIMQIRKVAVEPMRYLSPKWIYEKIVCY
jgi:radical SAM protein with 4Fe4S-binding SPASM domain